MTPSADPRLASQDRLRTELLEEWALLPDGRPHHGRASLVLPVRTADGEPAVLKLGRAGEASEHAALALQHWHGRGAVRLLRAHPGRGALLLERLSPRDLREVWDLEACEVVGRLYGRLHRPAPPRLRPLTAVVERWSADLEALPRDAPVPRRLVQHVASLTRDLVADPGEPRLLHADLHYGHVLVGGDGDWRAIDPEPLAGDPHYEPAPLLWHRWEELAGDVRGGLRRRFHAVVEAGGLDEERARAWVVVRMAHRLLLTLQDAERAGAGLDAGARERITRCVTGAKALAD